METAKTQMTGQASLRQDAYDAQVGQLKNRADAFGSLSHDRRTTQDQTTVKGQQEYDRESKLLPARRALTVCTREQAAAEKTVVDAVKLQAAREGDLEKARL